MRMEGDNIEYPFKLEDYEQYLRDISNHILEKFPKAVHSVRDGKVQIRNLDQME